MGFKTPQGVEIPRLKLLDNDGNVLQILTGPYAIEELNKRALAFKESQNKYETVEIVENVDDKEIIEVPIEEYTGNITGEV